VRRCPVLDIAGRAACACRNTIIDVDIGRMHVEEPAKAGLFRRRCWGLWRQSPGLPPTAFTEGPSVKTFNVQESADGVLVSLPLLLERLSFLQADFWVFRNIELNHDHGSPFGLTADEFERRTRETPGGLRVTTAQFHAFLQTDSRIVNGFIEGTNQEDDWLFQIECFDSGEWDISVRSPELAAALEKTLGQPAA